MLLLLKLNIINKPKMRKTESELLDKSKPSADSFTTLQLQREIIFLVKVVSNLLHKKKIKKHQQNQPEELLPGPIKKKLTH
jgi:hypothetical protein